MIYIRVICGFYHIFGENVLAQDCQFGFAIFYYCFLCNSICWSTYQWSAFLSLISDCSHEKPVKWGWETHPMGPSVKHVLGFSNDFLPVLPNHSGIVCFFKVPGQLVLWIVIKVDKLEDTRGTPRLTNFRQILLTHFSKSIRLLVWHQPGQMDKSNSICGNLNTYNIGTW